MKVSDSKNGYIKSIELLTPNRLDIVFKYLYLKFYDKSKDFADEIYNEHIKVITNGLYKEIDNGKEGIDEFHKSFIKTFNNIKEKRFNPEISVIPVTSDLSISNGAHRVASSIYLNQDVFYETKENKKSNYGYQFFKDRGISKNILELAVLNYIELKPNTFLALVWPSADKKKEYLSSFKNIIYEKKFRLNYNGAHNFLAQVYKEQKWIGDFSNGYGGAHVKLSESFKQLSDIHAIFFHEESLSTVNQIKDSLREKFNIGKASIHITDEQSETLELGKYILNSNSIHFLNNSKPYLFHNTFHNLKLLKEKLNSLNINNEEIIIDGGSVLSIYGIRDTNDLDYLCLSGSINGFDNHASQLVYHKEKIEDLLFNPKHYFYFNDFKFISIEQIKKMKKNRNEIKDRIDIKLINRQSKDPLLSILKVSNYINLFKTKLVARMIPISKKFGFYNFAKNIYKSIFK